MPTLLFVFDQSQAHSFRAALKPSLSIIQFESPYIPDHNCCQIQKSRNSHFEPIWIVRAFINRSVQFYSHRYNQFITSRWLSCIKSIVYQHRSCQRRVTCLWAWLVTSFDACSIQYDLRFWRFGPYEVAFIRRTRDWLQIITSKFEIEILWETHHDLKCGIILTWKRTTMLVLINFWIWIFSKTFIWKT